MSEENKPTVTYQDTEYNIEDLPERARQLVDLVQSVRSEASGIRS